MKKVCLINGSPKISEAVSLQFLNWLDNMLNEEKYNKGFINLKISANKNKFEEDFNKLANADIVIISFPLYIYCLPGILMSFLEEYYDFIKKKSNTKKDVRVYAIVNCGFPEPEINNEAIRVIQNFCNRLNLNWRFGVSIGCGPFIGSTKDIPIMKSLSGNVKNALQEVAKDIEANGMNKRDNMLVKPKLPTAFMLKMGASGWIYNAKKNGLKKEDLYRRPYVG